MIDAVCFVALIMVFTTVIYGFWLRAVWAHGYYLAVAVAILGAFVILIGLAQQAIAARDIATWRDMAEWQIRAARTCALGRIPVAMDNSETDLHSTAYYETLIGALVRHGEDEEAAFHER